MNTTIKLSVSSVLLAGLMTGCSQQQFQGGGQQVAGGSNNIGGQQILGGGQQVLGGQQNAAGGQKNSGGGQQVFGGQQALGGQQSAAGGQQALGGQQNQNATNTSHAHDIVAKNTEHLHNVEAKQRVYVPLPESMKETPPAVFMYKEPKPVTGSGPVYYDDDVYSQKSASMTHQKPVVRHKGIGMPPAQPGQCFAKVNTPAKFKNVVKRIQVSPAVNKRVKVRGPQYTWINKKVIARPATHRNEYIPPVYRNVSKQVLVKPAHYAWQQGKTGPVTRIDNMTGEILCRVKIPAVYRTVTQKVVVRAAQRVKRFVPAVYRTIKQKKLTSPAAFRNVNTPAKFVNKTYRTQISGPRQEWKPIVCKAPTSQNNGVQRPKPVARVNVSSQQNQQKQLHQQWLKQEAQRTRQINSGAQQQRTTNNRNAQLLANQQRRAQHAIKEKQRLAKHAQQRKIAQQARLRQVQIAKQKRMAQHNANLQAQRQAAGSRKLNAAQQSFAKPKARPYQQQRIAAKTQHKTQVQAVSHQAKQRVQPKSQVVTKNATTASNDNTPLTRANAVFRIQKALMQRGFNPGKADGKLGPSTVKALTAFQETKGLKTGTLNRDTLRALNLVN